MPATTTDYTELPIMFLIQMYGILLYTYTSIYLTSCLLTGSYFQSFAIKKYAA